MSIPKATEMTIRNFLLKELEKRNVKVSTECSYSSPIGRLVPDMLLRNGAQYVVETKLGAEAKMLDAIVRLYDYSKYTDAKGAFAVLFPEKLRRPWTVEMLEQIAVAPDLKYNVTAIFKDSRPSQSFSGNLSEIADWIASHVLRPLVVEADTGFAIKVLTEAVEAMTATIRSLRSKELEDIFGGKTVFENILEYEEGQYPTEEMRQAATYLLVNQIIFYHILSCMNLGFEPIDENKINQPADLLRYFEVVLKKDYSSIYGFDVVSRLPESATDIVRRVITVVKALAPEKIGQDVLGKVFHELIPFNIRKAVAAFYTNNEAAEILANLAIDKPDATVMDLACGSGTLLVAAYRRKKELLHSVQGKISLEDHKRFLEHDLTGIDIMPFAAHLAVMHLSLQALLHETEKVRVAVWDSTELKPGMSIPAIQSELKAAYRRPTLDMFKEGEQPKREYLKKGAITLEGIGGQEIPLEKADLVIMNPPFTRQERLPKEYKSSLFRRLKEYKQVLHGQLGLYGYFLPLADRFLKNDGRIAFVLPATILRIKSTENIRKWLLNNYQIEFIITTWQRAAFSEGAQFREILLVAKKTKRKSDNELCTVVHLKEIPKNLEEAKAISNIIRKERQTSYENHTMRMFPVSKKDLEQNISNWFYFIVVEDTKLFEVWKKLESDAKDKILSLSHYASEVKATTLRFDLSHVGRKEGQCFIIKEPIRAKKSYDRWIVLQDTTDNIVAVDRITQNKVNIPRDALSGALRRPSGARAIDVSEIHDYIVVSKFPEMNKLVENPRILKDWKAYVDKRKAHLLLDERFDISASGTSALAFYSEDPIIGAGTMCSFKGMSKQDARILALWLNSTMNLLQTILKRKETRGAWMRIHHYMFDDLLVVNPKSLTREQKELLFDTCDRYAKELLPSILQQLKKRNPVRLAIDEAFLKIFGYAQKETESMLDYLYPALANEIEKLKTLMEG
jgi:type I restriction-modification system DNA methylase subunit